MCKSALGRKRHRRCLCISIPLTILITATILILDVKGLCAHNPHDVVDDVAISPAYDQDQTLFIILSHRVLRSTDGGSSWKQLVKGLDFHGIMSTLAISPAYSIDRTLFLASRKHGIYRYTITIETSGTRNAKSAGHYIHVDALDVFGTTTMVKMEEK